jgi:spore germination protein YaaH
VPPGSFLAAMRSPRPTLRRLAPLGLAALLAVAVLPSAGMVGGGSPVRAATEIRPRVTGIKPLSHEVYGYLPYWRLDAGTVDRIRYDLVSTIAFFGLGIKSTGAIDRDWVGYKEYVGDPAAAVTNAAHDRGVRVVPTFQLFDSAAGHPKMTKFLTNPAAQDRFIAEALDLMAERQADGAGLDFEGVPALNPLGKYYVPFVAKFRAAMKARFPDSTLVNATSAGASERIITGLVPLVDYQMVMTYNYRSSGSSITGAISPLDHASRNVKIHMARILAWVPPAQVLLGVPYYGYNWPVTSKVANATVQTNKKKFGAVKSVTYASARDFLAAHPKVKRHYDALEGSAYYTYKSTKYKTYRQVYFEDEHSLADKYDYVLTTGLGGVGIWTLDNDRGYDALWNVLRDKFYAPIHAITVSGKVGTITKSGGAVFANVRVKARVTGTVPERGSWRWTIRDQTGKLIRSGEYKKQTLLPGRLVKHTVRLRLGLANGLRAGTYTLRVRFIQSNKTWRSPALEFRQRY